MHCETAKRMGLALLIFAVALRFFTAAGARSEQQPPQVWVLKIEEKQAPTESEPAGVFPVFSAQDAEGIALSGIAADVDAAALVTASYACETPAVLIYHTHTSEAYAQSAGWTYDESDPLRTTDPSHSVAAVGERVAEILRQRGVEVIHDTTFYDYPDYNAAYGSAGSAVKQLLTAHPQVDVVLDLHRDAVAGGASSLRPVVTLADGRQAAKLMLVVGTDLGVGGHPNWQQNLSLALKLQTVLQRRQQGICRPMDLRTERFNQFLSPGALLVEVGAAGNTLPEALVSGELLAHAVADLLVGAEAEPGNEE